MTTTLDNAVAAMKIALESKDIKDALVDAFATKCNLLIAKSIIVNDKKIKEVENIATENSERIIVLENMADDSEQDRRACHLIVRGIQKSDEPKITTEAPVELTGQITVLFSFQLAGRKEQICFQLGDLRTD